MSHIYRAGAGLAYDRNWMIVKEEKGKFVTQRQVAKLALIATSIPQDVLKQSSQSPPEGSVLTLEAPGMDKLQVPLGTSGQLKEVSCWEFQGTAYDQGEEAAAWLSKYLQGPHRLVRYAGGASQGQEVLDSSRRPTDARWVTDQEVAFADGYPALIVSEGLLEQLNERLEKPLPMNRFRPNIVVTDCKAAAEDGWIEYGIGKDVLVESVKPCDRCTVTCTDQDTAEVGKEPLVTLKTFRSSAALGWDMSKSAVFFGWNIVPKAQGAVHVNDDILLIKRRGKNDAVPNKNGKNPPATAKPQGKVQSQREMIKEGLWAALQGASVAVAVAGILMSLMYYLIKSTAPTADIVGEPT
ncbi:TPA: hypothetical protein ACH3X3_011428 [Trebouxia sp. C0006]